MTPDSIEKLLITLMVIVLTVAVADCQHTNNITQRYLVCIEKHPPKECQ